MEFYRFSKINVYVKKMDHSMDANPVLYLGVKIGKFGVLSFREFVTDSHEAFYKLFTKLAR